MQWQPKFITNLETSGNLSKCFVCIGSIFQIGYRLYCNERKQESLWSFIIFATKPEVIFLLWQKLKLHIMQFENMKKIPFAIGKKIVNWIRSNNIWRVSSTHFQVVFIYQFYTRMTDLVESTFWNPPELIIWLATYVNSLLAKAYQIEM